MKYIITIWTLLFYSLLGAQNSDEQISFSSKHLNDSRQIWISIPKNQANKAFPTAYLIGSNSDDFRKSILKNEFIVVGIETRNSKSDFLNSEARTNYLNFLTKELIPYINKHYSCNSVRMISGHSLAGGLVMEALHKVSDHFSFYMASSPTLNVINTGSFNESNFSSLKSLYFNIGLNENYPQLEQANHAFHFKLDSLKPVDLRWKFEVMKDETHETNAYTGFCRGYSFYKSLFSVPDSIIGQSIEDIVNYANAINTSFGVQVNIDEQVLMPNMMINLQNRNYNNVQTTLQYMATKQSELFNTEVEVLLNITEIIEKQGDKTTALALYQLIADKTNHQFAKIKVLDLNRKK